MARDYAKQKPGRRRQNSRYRGKEISKTKSTGALWLLTGVLAGLLIAGLFYIQNHGAVQLQNANESSAKIVKPESQKVAKIAKNRNNSEQPQFDFYTILPKMKVWVPNNQQEPTANQPAVPPPFTNNSQKSNSQSAKNQIPSPNTLSTSQSTEQNPSTTPVNNSPSTTVTTNESNTESQNAKPAATSQKNTTNANGSPYILQIAALENYQDADQLKAQLTLMGYDVTIKQTQEGNKTLNRVEIGPYNSLSDANKAQQSLQQQHVNSILVKASG